MVAEVYYVEITAEKTATMTYVRYVDVGSNKFQRFFFNTWFKAPAEFVRCCFMCYMQDHMYT